MFVKILLHLINVNYLYGGVGEVVNTLVCGTSMRGFDSHTPPHLKIKHHNYGVFNFLNYFQKQVIHTLYYNSLEIH